MPPAGALAAVLARVREEDVVELTRRLVRIPSVCRPDAGGEAAVAQAVAEWFHEEGFRVEVQEVAPGRPNVVAWIEGRLPGPTLCLEGHTDVVTEGDPAAWRFPPWEAVLADGRIYGRGAADTKGGLAAAMVGAAALRWSRVAFRGRLMVAALVDEEGGMAGARHFIRSEKGRTVDAAIVCEPEQNEVCLEQRGVVWVRVRARGRMAHGAMPGAGANPIPALARFVAGLSALERTLRRRARGRRLLAPLSLTPTAWRAPLAGVPQPNVIPGAAEVVVDARLVPGLGAGRVLSGLRALARAAARRSPGVRLSVEALLPPRPPIRVPRGAAVVRALTWAVRQVTGRPPRFGGVPGTTDGTVFAMERGIPVVTFGPGSREIPHQVDEYVEVRELVEAARCYAAAAARFLGAA